ncbi:MAG: MFS transporter [Paracoccaceae bacterium]
MTATEIFDSRYSWVRLAVCVLIAAIGNVGMWAIILVMPKIQAEFGVDRADVSLSYTTTMIGFALGNLLIGRFVDRFGISRALVISGIAIAAGFWLVSIATSIWQVAIVQGVLIGVGASTCFGPLIADVSHWFVRRRGIAVALAASGNYIAGAVWPVLLKDVIAEDGWRAAYSAVALVCVVTMVPLALLLRRRPEAAQFGATVSGSTGTIRSINLSPRALQTLLAVAGVACCVAMSMPQVHIVALCADLGYGVAVGAEMLALMVAGGVLSRLVFGFLSDRIGGVRTLLLGSCLQCIALFLYLPFNGMASLYVVSLVFGLSQGGIVPAYAIIVREYLPAREAGQRVGLVMMATIGGMAFGGWLSGAIFDATGSYQAAFLNGIGWNFLNIGIMTMILWRTGKRRAAVA